MNYNQVEQAITEGVGIMVVQDKPTLVAMLQRNGSMITEASSETQILDATFKAIKDNKRFRQDLSNYFAIQAKEAEPLSFSGDASFANYTPLSQVPTGSTVKTLPNVTVTAKKKTGFGNFLSSLFSKENVDKGIGLGMDFLSTKLSASANRQGNQQAINYKLAEAQAYAEQARAAEAMGRGGKKNKWILPVAIIGGVAVLGLVIYLAVRKK